MAESGGTMELSWEKNVRGVWAAKGDALWTQWQTVGRERPWKAQATVSGSKFHPRLLLSSESHHTNPLSPNKARISTILLACSNFYLLLLVNFFSSFGYLFVQPRNSSWILTVCKAMCVWESWTACPPFWGGVPEQTCCRLVCQRSRCPVLWSHPPQQAGGGQHECGLCRT